MHSSVAVIVLPRSLPHEAAFHQLAFSYFIFTSPEIDIMDVLRRKNLNIHLFGMNNIGLLNVFKIFIIMLFCKILYTSVKMACSRRKHLVIVELLYAMLLKKILPLLTIPFTYNWSLKQVWVKLLHSSFEPHSQTL